MWLVSTVFSSIVLLCVSSIIVKIVIAILILLIIIKVIIIMTIKIIILIKITITVIMKTKIVLKLMKSLSRVIILKRTYVQILLMPSKKFKKNFLSRNIAAPSATRQGYQKQRPSHTFFNIKTTIREP